MLCFAAFAGPAHSTVCGVDDCSFGANCPTFALVDKLHVKQVRIDAGFLSLPGATAVGRLIDVTTATDGPTGAVVDKRRRRETNSFFRPAADSTDTTCRRRQTSG